MDCDMEQAGKANSLLALILFCLFCFSFLTKTTPPPKKKKEIYYKDRKCHEEPKSKKWVSVSQGLDPGVCLRRVSSPSSAPSESFSLSLCSSARVVVEDSDPITPVMGTIDFPCSQFLIFRGEILTHLGPFSIHPWLGGLGHIVRDILPSCAWEEDSLRRKRGRSLELADAPGVFILKGYHCMQCGSQS